MSSCVHSSFGELVIRTLSVGPRDERNPWFTLTQRKGLNNMQSLGLAMSELVYVLNGIGKPTNILVCDTSNNFIRRISQYSCDDVELIYVVLSLEKRLPTYHLGENTSSAPYIDFLIIFLPAEHDIRGSIVPGCDIACHLMTLKTCWAEVANLEIAIRVDQYITWFKIAMDDPSRMYILETSLSPINTSGQQWNLGFLTVIWYVKYWMNSSSINFVVRRWWRFVVIRSVTR